MKDIVITKTGETMTVTDLTAEKRVKEGLATFVQKEEKVAFETKEEKVAFETKEEKAAVKEVKKARTTKAPK
jgi:hypothetical protein